MESTKQQDEQAIVQAARKYVDHQLETMKQHGSAPNLSTKAYNDLVQKVVNANR